VLKNQSCGSFKLAQHFYRGTRSLEERTLDASPYALTNCNDKCDDLIRNDDMHDRSPIIGLPFSLIWYIVCIRVLSFQ